MPFVACPLCAKRVPSTFIETHAANCAPKAKKTIRKTRGDKTRRPVAKIPFRTPKYALRPCHSSLAEVGAPGFHVFPGVFTDVHAELLASVHETAPEWTDYHFRKAKNYGPAYNLAKKRFLFGPVAPPWQPLPAYATELVMSRLPGLAPVLRRFQPNQLTAGLYPIPGDARILPHNDCENDRIETAVVGVCLGAACTMTLILRKGDSAVGHEVKRDVRLPACSVYVMSGDSLRIWHHAIFEGKTEGTRVSLTFRDVSPNAGPSQASS